MQMFITSRPSATHAYLDLHVLSLRVFI